MMINIVSILSILTSKKPGRGSRDQWWAEVAGSELEASYLKFSTHFILYNYIADSICIVLVSNQVRIDRYEMLMPNENSPTYSLYMFKTPDPASFMIGAGSIKPYRPATQLTQTDLDLAGGKGVCQHFQAPCNDHNRFLCSVPEFDRSAYRDIKRMQQPPFDKSGGNHHTRGFLWFIPCPGGGK
jgi:hypothetical protein